jgi:DNA-binding FadR family transcriptional regulator
MRWSGHLTTRPLHPSVPYTEPRPAFNTELVAKEKYINFVKECSVATQRHAGSFTLRLGAVGSMPLQAIESHRLYRQIADQLSGLIQRGEFSRGERLPSERDIAAQLGVSRQSVREALIVLELSAIVEVRVGAGIYVSNSRPLAESDPENEGQGPFELLRARWLVEGEIAAEAARKGSTKDVNAIRSALDRMVACERQNKSASDFDREFHIRIAAAAKNSALASVVRDLWDRGRGAIWKRMEHHFQTPELRAATLQDHRAVLEMIESGDARGARSAMRKHLARVEHEFSRRWEVLKKQEATRPVAEVKRIKTKTRSARR